LSGSRGSGPVRQQAGLPVAAPAAWRPLLAVTLAATLFTALQGLTYPLLALLLDRRGVPEGMIGLNAAMMPVGMVLAAPLATRLLRRVGALPVLIASLVGAVLTVLALGLLVDPFLWMPLRLGTGVCLALVFIVADTWVNELAPERLRGRILGLYSMLTSVGFGLGPLLLAAVGTRGFAPFAVGALLGSAALVPLWWTRRELPGATGAASAADDAQPRSAGRRPTLFSFIRAAPLLVAGVGATALADQVALSLLPIFCLRHGWSVPESTLALAAMVAGGTVFQYPTGWLADRFPVRRLYLLYALIATASSLAMPLAAARRPLLGMLAFLWGGTYYAAFTLALVLLGRRFRGTALVAGNAVFAATWGIGGLLGTPLTGAIMQRFGPDGFPLTVAFVFCALGLATLLLDGRAAGFTSAPGEAA
jgi:MFS family permease